MTHIEVIEASDKAWIEFYHSLSHSGYSDDQINKLDKLLNQKDCFNSVFSCLNGVTEHE